jgi:choloylglycine hydrolase
VNKRNITKTSFVFTNAQALSWKSQYGSVTFNQAGRDFPFSGVNEKGLNMEIMWLNDTSYPKEIKNPTVNESQIIQYVLDTASSTDEAIIQISKAEIVPIMAPVHYMICDKNNQCAVIEYLNKNLTVAKMNGGNERILQNTVYQNMLNDNIRKDGSTSRNSAADISSIFDISNITYQESFKKLEKVQQGSWTKWQIVYNLGLGEAWFRTNKNQKIKHVNLKDYELDCSLNNKEVVVDMSSDFEGDVLPHMEEFTNDLNLNLLTLFEEVPEEVKKEINIFTTQNHNCIPTKEL